MELRLRSVNVALPSLLATVHGEAILSGIAKRPLTGASVFVRRANLDGDGQADLSVHGGADKAVYAYPVENWPWWQGEHALACKPGTFGENLTTQGADEDDVAIGDRFAWGDALLEVSQPRAPCFKFALHTGRSDTPALMTVSARGGFYRRVIAEGEAPLGAALVRAEAGGGPSVREAFAAALHPRIATEEMRRVQQSPVLAEAWRNMIARRLGSRTG